MRRIDAYQQVLEISNQMVGLASAQNWEELEQLQLKRVDIFNVIAQQPKAVSATESEQLRQVILQIQACDAAVLELVGTSHVQIGKLLLGLARSS